MCSHVQPLILMSAPKSTLLQSRCSVVLAECRLRQRQVSGRPADADAGPDLPDVGCGAL
jgi:hypothetical protein